MKQETTQKKVKQLLQDAKIAGTVRPYPQMIRDFWPRHPFLITLLRQDQEAPGNTYHLLIFVDSDRSDEVTLESAVLGLALRALDTDHSATFDAWMKDHQRVPTSYHARLTERVSDRNEEEGERRRALQKLWSDYWYLRALAADLRTVFGSHYDAFLDLFR